ncbi:helix-turn-helix domain-containing protein [Parafrankia discariae]|uniref:helix-turn-helix domain-containing protein n=1 Tax=Parafrankia discariae TaxID=365528 RepID=UPI00036C3B30|nr:helix-turn-helix transcriptional regulator [Parafrankia discariae]
MTQLRKARRLTLVQLSERLTDLGRPILPTGLSKIEHGERGLSVDDLVALAAALDVSPEQLIDPSPIMLAVETVIQ